MRAERARARIHTFYDLKCQQLKQYYDEESWSWSSLWRCSVKNGIAFGKREQKAMEHHHATNEKAHVISMAIFNSELLVITRGIWFDIS